MSGNTARKITTSSRRVIEVRGLQIEVSKNAHNTVFIHRVGKTETEMVDRDVFSMSVEDAQRLHDMTRKSGGTLPELTMASVKALPDHTQVLFWVMHQNDIGDASEAKNILSEAVRLA